MKTIKKILIANRGEIALRIIRTCREMGIKTVAVFSDVDRVAPHVQFADEAYHIGAAPASESYLRTDRILEVLVHSNADAVHPGYGFFSENAEFAQAVTDAGKVFVGPSPDAIRLMGSKTASRKSMIAANVPVVPGTQGALESLDEARQVIEEMGGYPILIKAAAGGGGKGMRVVRAEEDLERALEAARGEAGKSFGDETVYIERYVEQAKHIEFQIIADQHGNTIHLLERDCSVQRRHQKVIEECPSPELTEETRARMGEVAIQAARACNYVNAGTVEFLYESDDKFYFLEMNTRLQVEHPVTEMVLGLDLVRMQIMIAEGQELPLTQSEVVPRGHAIECRINAEDVFNNFVPTTGTITAFQPPQGPGIRLDSGVEAQGEVSRFYDPMFAKLVAYAMNRDAAIDRMQRALREFIIEGVETTIPFCMLALDHPAFRDGSFTTKFIDLYWDELKADMPTDDELVDVIAAAIMHHRRVVGGQALGNAFGESETAQRGRSNWKLRAMKQWGR